MKSLYDFKSKNGKSQMAQIVVEVFETENPSKKDDFLF
jgi:hypothetical protein